MLRRNLQAIFVFNGSETGRLLTHGSEGPALDPSLRAGLRVARVDPLQPRLRNDEAALGSLQLLDLIIVRHSDAYSPAAMCRRPGLPEA
jgi:hypothetical protein